MYTCTICKQTLSIPMSKNIMSDDMASR